MQYGPGGFMNIVIVGCGKVGAVITEQLSSEDHNITLVDEDSEAIASVTNHYDAMGVVGNGVSYQTLVEAGITDCDLFIAVTDSDEKNLLACLIAGKTGRCRTIARVRNPIYSNEIEFLKREFNLAMVINPEDTAALEISRVFLFPSAFKIDTFSGGRIELFHFHVTAEMPICGQSLSILREDIMKGVIVCTIRRGKEVIIPKGDSSFQDDDDVSIAAIRRDALAFFRKLGEVKGRVRNAMIVGGGTMSYYLADRLLKYGIATTIVEIDYKRCEELSSKLPDARIIHGDGTNRDLLDQEEVSSFQGFAALTGLDEENILLSLYASKHSSAKVVTKIGRLNFGSVIDALNLDTIINPQKITADYIVKFARTMSADDSDDVESFYKLEDGRAEAIEFKIKEESAVTGVKLKDLKLRKDSLVCNIFRNGKNIVPTGQDELMVGDSVIVIMKDAHIVNVKEIVE